MMLCNSARLVKNEPSKFVDQPMLLRHANEVARSHRGSLARVHRAKTWIATGSNSAALTIG